MIALDVKYQQFLHGKFLVHGNGLFKGNLLGMDCCKKRYSELFVFRREYQPVQTLCSSVKIW